MIPQISVVLGPSAGGAVYSPAMTDFIFMVKGVSNMFITGPDVVKAVTGEDVTQEELGGAMTHATKSGVATFVYPDERSCLEQVRYLMSFLPANNLEDPPYFEPSDDPERSCDALIDLVPDSPNRPYDMKKVIAEIVDDGDFLEVFPLWADEHGVRLRRASTDTPSASSGTNPRCSRARSTSTRRRRRPASCALATRSTCRLLTFVDVPGFLPGTDQEYGGIIRHGAKLLYAYCESTVPRVQVITRKGTGGAYVVMNSKSIGADIAFRVADGRDRGDGRVRRREHHLPPRDRDGRRSGRARRPSSSQEYTERFSNPYQAAERGYVDDVIDPARDAQDARESVRDAAHET